jgi:ribose transport system substrate-binding protein
MKAISKIAGLVLGSVLLLSACAQNSGSTLLKDAGEAGPTASVQVKQYKIALVMKTLTNPFFVDMEMGAREAEDELGLQLIVRTGAQETSIEQQIQIVEELILEEVDAIVIAPGSSVDLVKVLKKAQDAGIVIVNIDNRLDTEECEKRGLVGVPFIPVRTDEAAYFTAKPLAELVTGPTEAAIIEGMREAENAELRKLGAVKAFEENPDIEIVSSESANWKIDEAYILAGTVFQAHPDVRLVFCANDMMALGVIQYLKETDKRDVLVAGFDDLDDMKDAIRDGWAVVTIDQQAYIQGYTGIVTAVGMLEGRSTEPETFIDAKVITAGNVDS